MQPCELSKPKPINLTVGKQKGANSKPSLTASMLQMGAALTLQLHLYNTNTTLVKALTLTLNTECFGLNGLHWYIIKSIHTLPRTQTFACIRLSTISRIYVGILDAVWCIHASRLNLRRCRSYLLRSLSFELKKLPVSMERMENINLLLQTAIKTGVGDVYWESTRYN